ncbi:MAG TPA: crotonase/enoyl-CoA hydratase family protein [Acidimicrobiia bacterium]|nr:crotonase/enoyl-CoA hydratase family protein [Acidimicrobiia bacterium]
MVIERETHGQTAVLRINRPEARNAVNREVAEGMEAALDAAEADDGIRVVVITGTGTVFCAGADLKVIARGEAGSIATKRGGFAGITNRDFAKPLIAAVNGPALAGGFEIVLSCDLVVASADARFGIPEVQRGLFAAAGGLIRLPRRVPMATAMELALTGEAVDAPRALLLGLVNRVVPTEAVLDEAIRLAERICENSPIAVRNSRRMVREAPDLTEAEAWPRNHELAMEVFSSGDAVEGATAFAEKRAPRWQST